MQHYCRTKQLTHMSTELIVPAQFRKNEAEFGWLAVRDLLWLDAHCVKSSTIRSVRRPEMNSTFD